jgi:hypothetical protein
MLVQTPIQYVRPWNTRAMVLGALSWYSRKSQKALSPLGQNLGAKPGTSISSVLSDVPFHQCPINNWQICVLSSDVTYQTYRILNHAATILCCIFE